LCRNRAKEQKNLPWPSSRRRVGDAGDIDPHANVMAPADEEQVRKSKRLREELEESDDKKSDDNSTDLYLCRGKLANS
jgi:hypothetical protein